jgi:hypothetical protein
MITIDRLTRAVQDYLKAVFALAGEKGLLGIRRCSTTKSIAV